ncbi:eukaryotic translation initiation factor 3 subunit A-like [Penaeus japonicus]|uniref:eukaryotic translation initiation factor 3 subunit A-like n=1 Tax=Penaeus japonicus TaxID=27405 RepID=UPI001C715A24|nr:eukaryotic translation initiation factor 3 subunit A-like [Penaeus japonicus]
MRNYLDEARELGLRGMQVLHYIEQQEKIRREKEERAYQEQEKQRQEARKQRKLAEHELKKRQLQREQEERALEERQRQKKDAQKAQQKDTCRSSGFAARTDRSNTQGVTDGQAASLNGPATRVFALGWRFQRVRLILQGTVSRGEGTREAWAPREPPAEARASEEQPAEARAPEEPLIKVRAPEESPAEARAPEEPSPETQMCAPEEQPPGTSAPEEPPPETCAPEEPPTMARTSGENDDLADRLLPGVDSPLEEAIDVKCSPRGPSRMRCTSEDPPEQGHLRSCWQRESLPEEVFQRWLPRTSTQLIVMGRRRDRDRRSSADDGRAGPGATSLPSSGFRGRDVRPCWKRRLA